MQHVLLISKSGIPLYSQSLKIAESELITNLVIIDREIIEMSSIIKAIRQALEQKITEQRNFKIMIEEGTHVIIAMLVKKENTLVREKMLCFIKDFELLFEDVLIKWKGDLEIFVPVKIL
ncbi:MAG: hypothetical protein ACXACP_08365, partial [Candidatus Hodarchaeales archaeon]